MVQQSTDDGAQVKDTAYAAIQLDDPKCVIDGSVVAEMPTDSVFYCVYNRVAKTAKTYLSREDPKYKLVFSSQSSFWGERRAAHGGVWELFRQNQGGAPALLISSDYVNNWPVMVEKWYSACGSSGATLLEQVRFSPIDPSATGSAVACTEEEVKTCCFPKGHRMETASPNPSAPRDGSQLAVNTDLGQMTTRGLLEHIAHSSQALRQTTHQTLMGQHVLNGRVDALQAQQQEFEQANQRANQDFQNLRSDFQTVTHMHQDTQQQVANAMSAMHGQIAEVRQELAQLWASSTMASAPEEEQWPTTAVTKVTIDGYEVDLGVLESPIPVNWWNYDHNEKAWLPAQTPVWDIDKQGYTVDLQSAWGEDPPAHRAVSVRFLTYRRGDRKRRRRNHW